MEMHIGLITRSQIDYALDLANEYDARGISVNLYLDQRQTGEEVGDSDTPVDCLYEAGILPRACKVHLLELPRMRDPRSFSFFRNLVQVMHEDGIELIHILLNPGEIWFALLACLLTDIPVVTTLIVPVPNTGERLPRSLLWAINRLAVSGSDMVIVNGSDQVELVNRLYGVPCNRIAYVPLSLYTRAFKWRNESISEEAGTVLFFGRAHHQKGLEYLVKAQPLITQQVPEARILIAVHGDDLHRCRPMIIDPSRFEITEGVVSGSQMAALFQRAAVVALPYISASTSGVLVTAYSFAKPVVASRVGCLSEYVEEGITGLTVPSCDVEELANAIIRMLQDDDWRHCMGKNAENWIMERQRCSVEQTLDTYKKAFSIHNQNFHFAV